MKIGRNIRRRKSHRATNSNRKEEMQQILLKNSNLQAEFQEKL